MVNSHHRGGHSVTSMGDSVITIGFCIWSVICVYLGFRAGRMTIDKPMAPITQKKEAPAIEEDPYHEAMYGKPQPRIQTIPGEES